MSQFLDIVWSENFSTDRSQNWRRNFCSWELVASIVGKANESEVWLLAAKTVVLQAFSAIYEYATAVEFSMLNLFSFYLLSIFYISFLNKSVEYAARSHILADTICALYVSRQTVDVYAGRTSPNGRLDSRLNRFTALYTE